MAPAELEEVRIEEARFATRPGITTPSLQELTNLSQEEFSTRFRRSAIKRAKLAGLQRNAEAVAESRKKDSG